MQIFELLAEFGSKHGGRHLRGQETAVE